MEFTKKEVIISESSAKLLAPYSPGIRRDHRFFSFKQIGFNPETGKLIDGGIEAKKASHCETCRRSLRPRVHHRLSLMQLRYLDPLIR